MIRRISGRFSRQSPICPDLAATARIQPATPRRCVVARADGLFLLAVNHVAASESITADLGSQKSPDGGIRVPGPGIRPDPSFILSEFIIQTGPDSAPTPRPFLLAVSRPPRQKTRRQKNARQKFKIIIWFISLVYSTSSDSLTGYYIAKETSRNWVNANVVLNFVPAFAAWPLCAAPTYRQGYCEQIYGVWNVSWSIATGLCLLFWNLRCLQIVLPQSSVFWSGSKLYQVLGPGPQVCLLSSLFPSSSPRS